MSWNDLPVDIWWLILKKFWSEKFGLDTRMYNNLLNPFISLDTDASRMGMFVSSDLFIMRRLCKTTYKMIKKYTRRDLDKNHWLITFPYS